MVLPVRTVSLGTLGKKSKLHHFYCCHCPGTAPLQLNFGWYFGNKKVPRSQEFFPAQWWADPWLFQIPAHFFPRFQFKNEQQCDITQQDLLHKQHSNLQINPAESVFPQNKCTETQNENMGGYPGFIGGIQTWELGFEGLFGVGFTGKGEAEFNDTTLEVYIGKSSLLLLLLLSNLINGSEV